jgi:anti-sigma B factor antagonist
MPVTLSPLAVEHRGDVLIVKVAVHDLLEEAVIQDVGRRLGRLVTDSGCRQLVLDLSAVQDMSSEMLGELIALYKKLGSRLALCGVQPAVAIMLEWTKLNRLFRIVADRDAALQAMTGSP